MNILLSCCSKDWAGFLDKLPRTLIAITAVIAGIFVVKYMFHWIVFLTERRQERKMAKEKYGRERWWALHNEIKKDLNALLEEKADELADEKAQKIAKDNEDAAMKKCEENREKEILKAEHDWYRKLLKEIKDLDLQSGKKEGGDPC